MTENEVRHAVKAESLRLGVEAITTAVLRNLTQFAGDDINTDGLVYADACFSSEGFEHVLLEGVLVISQELVTEGFLLGAARPGDVLISRTRRPIPAGCRGPIPDGGWDWCERATQYAEAVVEHIQQSVAEALGIDVYERSDPNW